MAVFTNKIIDAYYFNEDYSVIEIIFEDDDKLHSYILEVNPDHPDYKDLVADGWSTERLVEATVEYKKQQSRAYMDSIKNAVDIVVGEPAVKSKLDALNEKILKANEELLSVNKEIDDGMFDLILSENKSKDALFKFKLWALEQDIVKGSTKANKSAIRKAKSIMEGFNILYDISGSSE